MTLAAVAQPRIDDHGASEHESNASALRIAATLAVCEDDDVPMPRRALLATLAVLGVGVSASTCALGEKEAVCPGGAAAELFGEAACDVAAATACCALATACDDDPECRDFAACMRGCAGADASCFATCRAESVVDDDRPFSDLANCAGDQVRADGSACVLPELSRASCDADADVLAAFDGAGCQACLATQSCDRARACADDPVCLERMRCWGRECEGRPTPSCIDGCIGEHPYRTSFDDPVDVDADDAFVALVTALRTDCRAACNVSRELRCVEDYDWPETDGEPVEVALRLRNAERTEDRVGYSVSGCPPLNAACTPAVMSDERGFVRLELPTTSVSQGSGFRGVFDVTAPDQGEGQAAPSLVSRGRPDYRDRIDPDDIPIPSASQTDPLRDLDTGEPLIVGQIFDCYALFDFGLEGAAIETSRGRVTYLGEDNEILFQEMQSSRTGRFFVNGLDTDEPVTLTVTDAATGREVASATVTLRAGYVTQIGIYPSTR